MLLMPTLAERACGKMVYKSKLVMHVKQALILNLDESTHGRDIDMRHRYPYFIGPLSPRECLNQTDVTFDG